MRRAAVFAGSLSAFFCNTVVAAEMIPYSKQWDVQLKSLPPEQVLTKLDLDRPGLEQVEAAATDGERERALSALLAYYRDKFPASPKAETSESVLKTADAICRHVFQWGPYEPADYGQDIEWAIDPADDIEWVAAVYRFYWADDLRLAYLATRDDKYVRAFVKLTTDWIAKHPLEEWTRTHPKYTGWKGFAWLDLQTGIRASKMVNAFKAMVHSKAITPEFLAVFLASLYDHQHKTALIPMGIVHNKAMFEQRGVFNICHAFDEFSKTRHWAKLGLERAAENLLAQTTTDGVQREWCGSYHLAVLRDAIDIMNKAQDLDLKISDDYRDRVRAMCDYVFWVATPDLAWPMFGDTARPKSTPAERPDMQLYRTLIGFSKLWDDPKYEARARLDRDELPAQTSRAFEHAGIYVMRSGWGPESIYLALHCAPPPLSGHDQPDNGTFELYAHGRWLMTDTGYYTYGHDRESRNWHRQTQVHQTLTLDRKNAKIDGRLRLWHTSPDLDAVVVENPSYDGLVHRRTVWFVDRKFFVFLDEAIGKAPGVVHLNWQPAVGPVHIHDEKPAFSTGFPDANVDVQTTYPPNAVLEDQDGWYAWTYGKRQPRKTFSVRHPDAAPAAFVTVVEPYQGAKMRAFTATLPEGFKVGDSGVDITIRTIDDEWRVGRDLDDKSAWCRKDSGHAAAPSPPATGVRPVVRVEGPGTFGSTDTEDEFPAIGCDENGNIRISWVAFDGTSDVVLTGRADAPPDSTPLVLSETPGDHWRPALGRDGQGCLWVTWAQSKDGKWDIWGKHLEDGTWSNAIRLTHAPGNDFGQQLAVDSRGTLWMAWQSEVERNYEILVAPITPGGAGEPMNVSRHAANDWEPAIAAGRDGRVWVAWDSYRRGNYDVLLVELEDGQPGPVMAITSSPDYEAHAALAVDHQNRLWIAWDNGGPHWGKDNESGRKLHSQRSVELRCLHEGKSHEPAAELSSVLRGPLASFCELPELIVDGDGRLWLFVRHLTDLTPERKPGGRRPQARGIWNPYALCYADGRWSEPVQLPQSNGRNDMRLRACLDNGGAVWAAWADDARKPTRAEEPGNHNVHAARLTTDRGATGALAVVDRGQNVPVEPRGTRPQPTSDHHTITDDDRTYLLLYGDTHRHTDISRCGMNHDGSLMDTYRYGIDVAELDFLAISDHDQDILKHRYGHPTSPLQHYAWWRSEKYCDLFQIEDRFVTLYAYEHGGSFKHRGGHKNIIYAERGHPCIEDDSPEALFKALEGTAALAIPHQLADGPSATDWSKWDPRYERVAEIFQARGSYEYFGAKPEVGVTREGHYYWDALEMGIRIGVIASSDHGSVSTAYAGVYCTELSRDGVMEGLRNRRTFGAMNKTVLDFRLADAWLGEEVEVDTAPRFSVDVRAPSPIRKVQIVRDGRFIHTATPGDRTCRFEHVDTDLEPGQSAWYYVRCEQENDRYAWSSPIWVAWPAERSGG